MYASHFTLIFLLSLPPDRVDMGDSLLSITIIDSPVTKAVSQVLTVRQVTG